ncbi:uncharacterized protein LOC135357011 [Latimeria chalumnae]|uniref:uncharacterized protein LOC135357011 n=1 Tax=Latimeria chalumnae TaxID=7897 RepID=UPI00313D96FC
MERWRNGSKWLENFKSTSSRLIFVRLFLFCLSAARFSLFSFLPIYFHSWGISALEFGCLYGMKQLVSMLLLPLLLKLVAKSKLQTCIVFFMILGAFAVVSLLVWSVNPYQGNTSTYCGQTNVTDSKVRAANLSEVSLRRGFFSAPDKGKEINTTEDLSKVQPQNNGASFALDREKGILKRKHSLPPFLSLQHKAQRAGQWLPFLFDGPNRFTTAAKNTRAAAATSRQSLKQKPLQRSSARKQYGRGFHVRRGENAPLVFSKVSKRSNSLQDWYIQQDLSKLYETYLEDSRIETFYDGVLDYFDDPFRKMSSSSKWQGDTIADVLFHSYKPNKVKQDVDFADPYYASLQDSPREKQRAYKLDDLDLRDNLEKKAQQVEKQATEPAPTQVVPKALGFNDTSWNETSIPVFGLAYFWMMGIILVSDCLLTSVQFITEDALWDFLETTDLLAQHDRLKRWTSIGSLSASVVIYFVIKFRICWRPTVNPFVFHVICSSIFAICAMGILFSYPVDYFTVYTYHRSSVATAMKLLFCDIRNSPYIFVGLFTGFLSFGFDVVQIWYLCDMGGPAIFIASLLLIQCLVELLMHRTCHKWKRPILPYHWMHCLTIVAIGLRSMAYYFIRSMWVFLPVEILFACSHTLVLITFEAFSEYISPPGVERSVRFLLLLFYSGPGMGLGACLGGFLYSSYGSRVFYGAHVGVTVVVLVLVLPLKFILPSRIYSFSRLLSLHNFPVTPPVEKAVDSSDSSAEVESNGDRGNKRAGR